jgi:hypothetical protein
MILHELNERLDMLGQNHPKDILGFTIGTLASYDRDTDYYLTPIRKSKRIVYTGAIVRNVETAIELTKIVDKKVAFIFVDSEKKISRSNYGENDIGNIEKAISKHISSATLLAYKGNDLTVKSADTLIRVLTPNLTGAKIAITGMGNIGIKLALSLLERGNSVFLHSHDPSHSAEVANVLNKIKFRTISSQALSVIDLAEATNQAHLLIATSNRKQFIGLHHVKAMVHNPKHNLPLLIDVGKGCFRAEVNNDVNVIMRVDIGDELSGEIDSLITQLEFLKNLKSAIKIGGTRYISRGVVGNAGDIVLDSLLEPCTVLGRCDGNGNLQSVTELEQAQILKTVKTAN